MFVVIAGPACLLFGGCGERGAQGQYDAEAEAQSVLFADLRKWDEAASVAWRERSLAEVLPNTKAWVDDGRDQPRRLSDLAVIGRVSSVEPGRGFEPSDESGSDREVSFESEAAAYRTLEATVNVTQAWGTVVRPESVIVAIPIRSGVEAATAMAAVESLGTVVLVLENQGFYSYAPRSWRIARNNALLGLVAKGEKLSFPALSEGSEYFEGADTLDEFARMASQPERTIDLRPKT
ncbi:MAG: hypothetical protein ACRCYU_20960 [Nocardioides sp.]